MSAFELELLSIILLLFNDTILSHKLHLMFGILNAWGFFVFVLVLLLFFISPPLVCLFVFLFGVWISYAYIIRRFVLI